MDNKSKDLLAFGVIAWTSIGTVLQMRDIVNLVPVLSPGWIYMTLGGLAAAAVFHLIRSALGAWFSGKEKEKRLASEALAQSAEREERARSLAHEKYVRSFTMSIEDLFRQLLSINRDRNAILLMILNEAKSGNLNLLGYECDRRALNQIVPISFWTKHSILDYEPDGSKYSMRLRDIKGGDSKFLSLHVRKEDALRIWPDLA